MPMLDDIRDRRPAVPRPAPPHPVAAGQGTTRTAPRSVPPAHGVNTRPTPDNRRNIHRVQPTRALTVHPYEFPTPPPLFSHGHVRASASSNFVATALVPRDAHLSATVGLGPHHAGPPTLPPVGSKSWFELQAAALAGSASYSAYFGARSAYHLAGHIPGGVVVQPGLALIERAGLAGDVYFDRIEARHGDPRGPKDEGRQKVGTTPWTHWGPKPNLPGVHPNGRKDLDPIIPRNVRHPIRAAKHEAQELLRIWRRGIPRF
jgi:hypothetical protein